MKNLTFVKSGQLDRPYWLYIIPYISNKCRILGNWIGFIIEIFPVWKPFYVTSNLEYCNKHWC